MKKKIVSLLALIMVLLVSIPMEAFANESGKVIFISMNRTNLEDMLETPVLGEEIQKRGYLALMNVRGDKGTDDRRSYASMGAGGRANVSNQDDINFTKITDDTKDIFKSATGQEPKEINDMTINKSLNDNEDKGQYGSTLGSMGQTLDENDLKVSVLGNSDTIDPNNGNLIKNRNIGLLAMDNHGRIDYGNVDDINIEDASMPFGISTDYNKLIEETKESYEKSDAIFIELGDTFRLDMYKSYLNDTTYEEMKNSIQKNIGNYVNEVLSLVNENDTIYVASAFPSGEDYQNRKRLSPVIKFDGDGKGLLKSSTTRRDGIVANVDIGVDILNEFGLDNDSMVGRLYSTVDRDDNVEFIQGEFEKIVSISEIRASVINGFVGVISASWVIAMIAVFFRKYIPKKKLVFKILEEIIKLGIIMPLAFLIAPIFNFKSQAGITSGILLTTLALYAIGKVVFKDDLKHMGFFALVTILVIVVDSIFGTYLMKNNIMSYDAIVGARYYGIGNEYEGVTIGSAIFALAVLLQYKKIPKWLVVILSGVILVTSAYPGMGANVGGAISESVAYLLFILLIFDVKLDIKKFILIGLAAVGVVVAFAVLDMVSGSESHLSVFVNQIIQEGPSAIIQTFTRKIEMNLKLAQTSVWVNILLAGIAVIAALIFKPTKHFKKISDKYPMIFKGFIASMVGCLVTLLVNDSGIVAASTASIYILIPLIIISINMIIFEEK